MQHHDILHTQALHLWESGQLDESVGILRDLVSVHHYLPAYADYLWRIWGDGHRYDEFMTLLGEGITRGSLDCQYLRLWKDFSNRPATDEYWTKIDRLALYGQKNALLAAGLNEYLHGTDRLGAVRMICQAHPCRSSAEVLTYIFKYGRQEEKCLVTEFVGPIRLTGTPHRYERHPVQGRPAFNCLNDYLSNEQFNATVFSRLRMLERKRIAAGNALSYADIKDAIVRSLPLDVHIMEGLTKNSWSLDTEGQSEAAGRHSLYLMKRLDDGRYMTLRIGDHTSNIGDYYKYRRMFVPSDREAANLCIMFHGDREQEAQLSYSFRFRAATADPCVTVRDEDFQVYQPFFYTLMHYIPGLITDTRPLTDAINRWFSKDGNEPYCDPYYTIADQYYGTNTDSPSARCNCGQATIETWDIKYERRRREREEKETAG